MRFLTLVLFHILITSDLSSVHSNLIPEDVRDKIAPYLMPEDHPIKPILDELFTSSRAILSLKSLKQAGFIDPYPRPWTHLIVTQHPSTPGFVFKLYLDAQKYFKDMKEYDHWLLRIHGAQLINQEITANGWQEIFKTPKNWIYCLPDEPAPPKEFNRKYCILVEEDMDILDTKSNYLAWESERVTEDLLLKFYILCETVGLHDCAKPENAPFSRDGKIAFIDTETFKEWPVSYKKMTPYLSHDMQSYWRSLIKSSPSYGAPRSAP